MESFDVMVYVLAGVLGVVMGSAVTAIAWRVPRGRSWVRGRSACPYCRHELEFLDLVPVLSWAFHRGRCRHCGARISPRYPITELLCGAWAVLLLPQGGLSWTYPLLAVGRCLLIALLWIVCDCRLLP